MSKKTTYETHYIVRKISPDGLLKEVRGSFISPVLTKEYRSKEKAIEDIIQEDPGIVVILEILRPVYNFE